MADREIQFNVKRQDGPEAAPYWEEFTMPYSSGHNVVSALMYLREHPCNANGETVNPVVWDCNCMEEVCGACAMLINGVPRQACAALVDDLEQPIVLEPLSKFPVVRDLVVDRQRMFDALLKIKAWVPVDGSWDIHRHAPLISPNEQSIRYLFSRCMTCGCCMEACPQFQQDSKFIGPAPFAQVRLHNSHPTGSFFNPDRLHAIMGEGGITDCGNAQNCVEVCPKDIPLTDAIAELGRQTTIQWIRDLFVR
ncbi:MAG: succinate dehydrogenase iron-sulfur subunit [Phycisphaerales bacterium]|nr:MAG: succinate dehydrogenase iron-sulfur subunit [Phycisphaerales bacterium]